ncbi:ATP-binding protein [Pseudonocardia sp. RS11V-5]|uniref:ATP-binding protein n=1 Tax=Pseudonocardia terrae TaxID=2905831 RepID=UPI001E61E37C|nr:ATP-binding protein [Pseudonocardia terrae]MCE3553620.1 ATP-binding protein [Pseudonocardia terrae]
MERDVSSASWLDEPGEGATGVNGTGGRGVTGGTGDERPDLLLAGLARRICGHAERQLSVAERLGPDSAEGAEIAAGARRMLRDGESVLSLVGGRPERRGPVPTGIGRILADTAAGAEDPQRVSVPPAPSASLAAGSAVGAGQVLAELVAHAERTVPRSSRIELVGRWAGDGGVTIELQAEGVELPWQEAAALENEIAGGASAPIPPERLGLHLAARLARRCGARLELQAPLGGPATPGFGTVALVRFPRSLVEPAAGVQVPQEAAPAPAPPPTPAPREPRDPGSGITWEPVRAGSAPAPASVDELFGSFDAPLAPSEEDLAGTPIFAAVASAWFRTNDDPAPATNGSSHGWSNGSSNGHGLNGHGTNGRNGHGGGHNGSGLADSWLDTGTSVGGDALGGGWAGSADDEWRAAAERAARADTELPTTGSGLPRRQPGRQMVTPPLRSRRGAASGAAAGGETSAERQPDRVRNRLSTYQRGLEAGRHRATDPEDEPSYQSGGPELEPQPEAGGPAVQGPVPGPTLERRFEETRDPWTGEGLWGDDR